MHNYHGTNKHTHTFTFTVLNILSSSQRKLIPLRFILTFGKDKLITWGHAASGARQAALMISSVCKLDWNESFYNKEERGGGMCEHLPLITFMGKGDGDRK